MSSRATRLGPFALLALPLPLALAGIASSARGAQDPEEELPDDRPEIEELIDALDEHVDERGEEDVEAIAVLDELIVEFPKSGPKDREDIVDAFEDCLKVKRPEEEGVFENKLFLATAVALGEMGPESVEVLIKQLDNRTHKHNIDLRRQLLLSLGRTADVEDASEELTDYLLAQEAVLQAAAAEALGNFDRAPQKERKRIVDELLKLIGPLHATVRTSPADTVARQRYDTIAAPVIGTLQRLTGHDETDPERWRAWWNDHKKDDWEKG